MEAREEPRDVAVFRSERAIERPQAGRATPLSAARLQLRLDVIVHLLLRARERPDSYGVQALPEWRVAHAAAGRISSGEKERGPEDVGPVRIHDDLPARLGRVGVQAVLVNHAQRGPAPENDLHEQEKE